MKEITCFLKIILLHCSHLRKKTMQFVNLGFKVSVNNKKNCFFLQILKRLTD